MRIELKNSIISSKMEENIFTKHIGLMFRVIIFIFYMCFLFPLITIIVWGLNNESILQTIKEVFILSFYFCFYEHIEIVDDENE